MKKSPCLPLTLFCHLATVLSLNDFRQVHQVKWADELDVSQPSLGKALDTLVEMGVYELGPKEGTAKTYRINAAYPGIQFLFNRQR